MLQIIIQNNLDYIITSILSLLIGMGLGGAIASIIYKDDNIEEDE